MRSFDDRNLRLSMIISLFAESSNTGFHSRQVDVVNIGSSRRDTACKLRL